jgi:hypothetical protein
VGSSSALNRADRALLLGIFPLLFALTTFALFLFSGFAPFVRELAAFGAFCVPLSLGRIAVRWLADQRRVAYLVAVGLGLTIIVGALFLFLLAALAGMGDPVS